MTLKDAIIGKLPEINLDWALLIWWNKKTMTFKKNKDVDFYDKVWLKMSEMNKDYRKIIKSLNRIVNY